MPGAHVPFDIGYMKNGSFSANSMYNNMLCKSKTLCTICTIVHCLGTINEIKISPKPTREPLAGNGHHRRT